MNRKKSELDRNRSEVYIQSGGEEWLAPRA